MSSSKPVLGITFCTEPVCLVDSNGNSVWPVWSRRVLDVLFETAALFGAELCERACGSCDKKQLYSHHELVLSLGSFTSQPAHLYAHLTGREHRHLETNLDYTLQPTVVISTTEQVTSDLLDTLYPLDGSPTYACGLIFGDTLDDLYITVVKSAAAATLLTQQNPSHIAFHPLINHTVSQQGEALLIGGKASRKARLAACEAGAGVLEIVTHSDGIDAYLGDDLTLCPVDKSMLSKAVHRGPRCCDTGQCHRYAINQIEQSLGDYPTHEMLSSVEDAWETGDLIAPEQLRARILLLSACTCIRDPNGTLDPKWGIAYRLMSSATLGAIITTWEMDLPDSYLVNQLAHELASGLTAGEAIIRFNSNLSNRVRGSRFCLLGDPRIRAMPTNSKSSELLQRRFTPLSQRRFKSFIELYLASVRTVLPAHTELWQNAIQAIKTDFGQKLHPIVPSSRAAQEAVLHFLFVRGGLLSGHWLQCSQFKDLEPSLPCFGCGRRVKVVIANLPVLEKPNYQRRLRMCPLCRVVEDAPIGSNFTYSVLEDRILVNGTFPDVPGLGGVLIDPTLPADRRGSIFEIPRNQNYQVEVLLPQHSSAGECHITTFLLLDDDIVVLSRLVRLKPNIANTDC